MELTVVSIGALHKHIYRRWHTYEWPRDTSFMRNITLIILLWFIIRDGHHHSKTQITPYSLISAWFWNIRWLYNEEITLLLQYHKGLQFFKFIFIKIINQNIFAMVTKNVMESDMLLKYFEIYFQLGIGNWFLIGNSSKHVGIILGTYYRSTWISFYKNNYLHMWECSHWNIVPHILSFKDLYFFPFNRSVLLWSFKLLLIVF
jgi:hypothetical protein